MQMKSGFLASLSPLQCEAWLYHHASVNRAQELNTKATARMSSTRSYKSPRAIAYQQVEDQTHLVKGFLSF